MALNKEITPNYFRQQHFLLSSLQGMIILSDKEKGCLPVSLAKSIRETIEQ